jgi:selenide,water dikinase
MGGKPILALALVGMPIDKLPHETIRAILLEAPPTPR